MPTATEFTALGAGNGFPACIPVAEYPDSSITEAGAHGQTNLKLNEMMHVFWNLYSIDFTHTLTVGANPPIVVSDTLTAERRDPATIRPFLESKPINRICDTLDGAFFFERISGNTTALNLNGVESNGEDEQADIRYRFGRQMIYEEAGGGALVAGEVRALQLDDQGRVFLMGHPYIDMSSLVGGTSDFKTGTVTVTRPNGGTFDLYWLVLGDPADNSLSISLDFYTY